MRRILVCICAALMCGCSIKEDRTGCPAWLHLCLSQRSLSLAAGLPVELTLSHGGGSDTLLLDACKPDAWVAVERGQLRMDALLSNGAAYEVPWGAESDSLWACSQEFSLLSEEGSREVELHKRFATVWFSFDDEPDFEQIRIVVSSGPPGEFRCLLEPEAGETSVRLPAQSGERGLELRCSSLSGGNFLWDWDLAAALRKAGYDWEAEDLSDVRVKVTLAPVGVSVEIVPWEAGDTGLKLEI